MVNRRVSKSDEIWETVGKKYRKNFIKYWKTFLMKFWRTKLSESFLKKYWVNYKPFKSCLSKH